MTIYTSKNLEGLNPLKKEFDIRIRENFKKEIKTIGLLNLMPTKCETETQILRLLCETGEDLRVECIKLDSYKPKNISYEYIKENYLSFGEIKDKLDGIIITGAPLEKIDFEAVDYIEELREVLDYSKKNIKNSLHICWGAQVALNHFYSIKKLLTENKIFGVFSNEILKRDKILDGIDSGFKAPQSRHTTLNKVDINNSKDITVLAVTEEGEEHLIKGNHNDYYILGHIEYDKNTLEAEYLRDINKGFEIDMPKNYFVDNNLDKGINFNWHKDGVSLYKNWIRLLDK
ncbi:MAG: homoserine O-acetyltransferase/O-succinyltransferase family protein [Sarcina sp.]